MSYNCAGEGTNSAAKDESCVTVRMAVLQRGHKLAGRQCFHKGWLGRAAQLDMGQVGLSVVHHPVSDQLTMIRLRIDNFFSKGDEFSLTLNYAHCRVNIGANEQFLKSGQWPQLTVYSAGHSMQVFVNGRSYGTNIHRRCIATLIALVPSIVLMQFSCCRICLRRL